MVAVVRLLTALLLLAGVLLLVALIGQGAAGSLELAVRPGGSRPAVAATVTADAGPAMPDPATRTTAIGRYARLLAQANQLRLAPSWPSMPVGDQDGAAVLPQATGGTGTPPPTGNAGATVPKPGQWWWREERLALQGEERPAPPDGDGSGRTLAAAATTDASGHAATLLVQAPAGPSTAPPGPTAAGSTTTLPPHRVGIPEPMNLKQAIPPQVRALWILDDHSSLETREQLLELLRPLKEQGFELAVEMLPHDRREVDPNDAAAVKRKLETYIEYVPGETALNYKVYTTARELGMNVWGLMVPRPELRNLLATLPRDEWRIRLNEAFSAHVADRLDADPAARVAAWVGINHAGYPYAQPERTANGMLAARGYASRVVGLHREDGDPSYEDEETIMSLAIGLKRDPLMVAVSGFPRKVDVDLSLIHTQPQRPGGLLGWLLGARDLILGPPGSKEGRAAAAALHEQAMSTLGQVADNLNRIQELLRQQPPEAAQQIQTLRQQNETLSERYKVIIEQLKTLPPPATPASPQKDSSLNPDAPPEDTTVATASPGDPTTPASVAPERPTVADASKQPSSPDPVGQDAADPVSWSSLAASATGAEGMRPADRDAATPSAAVQVTGPALPASVFENTGPLGFDDAAQPSDPTLDAHLDAGLDYAPGDGRLLAPARDS
jgi:hypothetical protein